LEISGYEFDPYVAFVPGSLRDSARVAFGIMGGIGNAKVTTNTGTSMPKAPNLSSSFWFAIPRKKTRSPLASNSRSTL